MLIILNFSAETIFRRSQLFHQLFEICASASNFFKLMKVCTKCHLKKQFLTCGNPKWRFVYKCFIRKMNNDVANEAAGLQRGEVEDEYAHI